MIPQPFARRLTRRLTRSPLRHRFDPWTEFLFDTLTVPNHVTFTRSSVKNVRGADGVYQQIAANVAPLDFYDLVGGRGWLIEGARTNRITQSNPGAAATTGVTATDLTVSKATDTDSSFQDIAGEIWSISNSAGGDRYFLWNGTTGGTTKSAGFVRAKVTAGAPSITIAGTGAPATSIALDTSGDWADNTISFTPGNADNQLQITVPDGATLQIAHAQMEHAADQPSSPILTSGSIVTRAADVCYAALAPWWNWQRILIVCKYLSKNNGKSLLSFRQLFAIDDAGNDQFQCIFGGTGSTRRPSLGYGSGAAVVTVQPPDDLVANVAGTFACSLDAGGGAVSVNGSAVVADATAPSLDQTKSLIYFGSAVGGSSGQMNGHLLSFEYAPMSASSAVLQDLSP